MKKDTRNITDLKQNNLRDIIKIVKIYPNITKTAISKKIGMTSVSAHNFISILIEKGLCVSSGKASSETSGRKAVQYRMNKNYGYIVGAELSRTAIHFTAYDMANNLLAELHKSCDIRDKTATLDKLYAGVEGLLSERVLIGRRHLCTGITIPGRANREGCIVLLPDADIWSGCPLKALFEEHFGVTSYVENDNNANILASKWLGMINDETNAVFLTVAEGVGIGIITSRELFRGTHDKGTEIGHTIVNMDGRLCSCGNKGCLQAYVSDQAIYTDISYLLASKYSGFAEQSPNIAQIAVYAKKNKCNDLYAAFYAASDYITAALHNIIKIYDPSVIMINSNWLKILPDIFDNIKLRVYASCGIKDSDNVKFILDFDRNIMDLAPSLMAFDNFISTLEIK